MLMCVDLTREPKSNVDYDAVRLGWGPVLHFSKLPWVTPRLLCGTLYLLSEPTRFHCFNFQIC